MKRANVVSITGGEYKGRRILTPGGKTHPMGERERLALFNMLTAQLLDTTVLDAFAGSGALGIEALSRGANKVVFVDNSKDAVRTIEENTKNLEIEDRCKIVYNKASDITSELGAFNVILADPPYDDFKISEIKNLVSVLKAGGTLVLSHPNNAPKIDGVVLDKTRQYARAHISFYHK